MKRPTHPRTSLHRDHAQDGAFSSLAYPLAWAERASVRYHGSCQHLAFASGRWRSFWDAVDDAGNWGRPFPGMNTTHSDTQDPERQHRHPLDFIVSPPRLCFHTHPDCPVPKYFSILSMCSEGPVRPQVRHRWMARRSTFISGLILGERAWGYCIILTHGITSLLAAWDS
jgi:hypothetical protein